MQVTESSQCPLCSSNEITVEDSLAGEQLFKLWRESGFSLAPDDLAPVVQTVQVQLWHCCSCEFRFFDQGLTGTDRFYRQLSLKPGYYSNDRPEFARTLQWVRSLLVSTVLDVGCGDGAFLDLARAAGLATYGIELNKD